jgi:hypothetical protein
VFALVARSAAVGCGLHRVPGDITRDALRSLGGRLDGLLPREDKKSQPQDRNWPGWAILGSNQ